VLQVAQHAHEDLPRRGWGEHALVETSFGTVIRSQPLLTLFARDDLAEERVDQHAAPFHPLHEEMSGEADPHHRQAQARGDFGVDEAQRDRDAGVAVEHFVEKAVARILVALRVAREAELAETGNR